MSQSSSKTPGKQSLKRIVAKKAGALAATDTVATAGQRLRENDANLWPVAEDRKLVGVIQDSNPDWKIGGEGHDPKTWKVGDIMSRELVFCYEDEDCATAQRLMQDRGLRHLPVVDREMRIVGVFSREEIEVKSDGTAGAETSPSLPKS
jgi:CBS domain-containing protein